MESATGRLVVMTTLPTERVIAILKDVYEHAEAGDWTGQSSVDTQSPLCA